MEKKRVLIITYYWPPAGGAGVQRWLKFAKYLPEFDIEPIILTVNPEFASYPQKDESLLKEIPKDLRVIATKSFEILNIYSRLTGNSNIPFGGFAGSGTISPKEKLARFIRGNFFLPDARKGWNKFAKRKALELVDEEGIETVITTGPPQSTHLIGLFLKGKRKINWIADFRDPWVDIYYYNQLHLTSLAKKYDLYLQRKVMNHSDKIITVSPGLKSKLIAQGCKTPVEVIFNGFDEDDFKNLKESEKIPGVINVGYSGTMAESYRSDAFWEACILFNKSNDQKKIHVKIAGSVTPVIKKRFPEIIPYLSEPGYLPHQEAIQEMNKCDLLLLVIPDSRENHLILTGKLFEYLALNKPVLGIGPVEGDAAKVLEETKSGIMVEYDNPQLILSFFESFAMHSNNNSIQERQKFSRKVQTERVAEIVKNLK